MISDCRNLNHYLAGFDLKFVIGADEAFDGASAKSFLIVRLRYVLGFKTRTTEAELRTMRAFARQPRIRRDGRSFPRT